MIKNISISGIHCRHLWFNYGVDIKYVTRPILTTAFQTIPI